MADQASNHTALDDDDRVTLRGVARDAIEHGLQYREPARLDPQQYSDRLQRRDASFVTIKSADDDLIGCIGGLEARRPLVLDVSLNAFRAAFHDPRTDGVNRANWSGLRVTISVLHSFRRLEVESNRELIQSLRPHRDGVIVESGDCRATFLPSVWASLSDPARFVDELRRKAGLSTGAWSPDMRWTRYEVDSF
ncbi:MAG: AmmeMemoRadiSam system protein A [Phycisphaerales bacterium]